MKLLTAVAAEDWCRKQGCFVGGDLVSKSVTLPPSGSPDCRVTVPTEATEAAALAYVIAMTAVPDFLEGRFEGAMLWMRRWEIWSESIDRVGLLLLNGVRASSGQGPALEVAPAHLFLPTEFDAAHACLTLPLIFQWDAHFVPERGAFVAFVSHEGHVDLWAANKEMRGSLLGRLERWLAPVR